MAHYNPWPDPNTPLPSERSLASHIAKAIALVGLAFAVILTFVIVFGLTVRR